jgi:uncharacterized membrane protein
MTKILIAVLVIASAGLAFSGYLAYRELFSAAAAPLCTPVGEPGSVLGAPPCIYGFFMYLAIAVLATAAILKRRKVV